MARVALGGPRLVAVAVDGPDPGLPPAGPPSGVAQAPVRQPARAADAQAGGPGGVQLRRRGQMCPAATAEGLGLPEAEALGGGAMEHLTCKTRPVIDAQE